MVNFEAFRPALAYGDGAKGGRPPYDPVAMFKVLILAAQNMVSDARMEFLIRDRLSWLRFWASTWAQSRRREHDPAVPREADAQRRAQCSRHAATSTKRPR